MHNIPCLSPQNPRFPVPFQLPRVSTVLVNFEGLELAKALSTTSAFGSARDPEAVGQKMRSVAGAEEEIC